MPRCHHPLQRPLSEEVLGCFSRGARVRGTAGISSLLEAVKAYFGACLVPLAAAKITRGIRASTLRSGAFDSWCSREHRSSLYESHTSTSCALAALAKTRKRASQQKSAARSLKHGDIKKNGPKPTRRLPGRRRAFRRAAARAHDDHGPPACPGTGPLAWTRPRPRPRRKL